MSAKRIFLQDKITDPDTSLFILKGEDVRYISRVMRLGEKDPLSLVDGSGIELIGTIGVATKDQIEIDIHKAIRHPAPEKTELKIIYGIAKGAKTDLVLQKATELGIDTIQLAICQRSVARPKESAHKINRYREVIRQACRQSERIYLPKLEPITTFDEALASTQDLNFIAQSGGSAVDMHQEAIKRTQTIAIAIGPEGGFSDQELQLAKTKGFIPISLGKHILRSETAAITALSLLTFLSGRMS